MEIFILLQQALGKGKLLNNNESIFHCPKCRHYKPKLQVNLVTGKFHCWVCGEQNQFKGRSFHSLFQKIGMEHLIQQLENAVPTKVHVLKQFSNSLPNEYRPLFKKSSDLFYKHALQYVLNRKITTHDIVKYQIGFCDSGQYKNRIIIPSFDETGKLNYFIARQFLGKAIPYLNPPMSKDVVIFGHLISKHFPIVLCEGVFDAMTIKRNAIPLLGKTIGSVLMKILIKVPKVYVCLDADAQDTAIYLCEQLLKYGIDPYLVSIPEGDPADIGFEKCWKLIDDAKLVDQSDLMLYSIKS